MGRSKKETASNWFQELAGTEPLDHLIRKKVSQYLSLWFIITINDYCYTCVKTKKTVFSCYNTHTCALKPFMDTIVLYIYVCLELGMTYHVVIVIHVLHWITLYYIGHVIVM